MVHCRLLHEQHFHHLEVSWASKHDPQLCLPLVLHVSSGRRRNRERMGVSVYLQTHPAYSTSWKREAWREMKREEVSECVVMEELISNFPTRHNFNSVTDPTTTLNFRSDSDPSPFAANGNTRSI